MKCLLFSLHSRPWRNTSACNPATHSSAVAMAHRDSGWFLTKKLVFLLPYWLLHNTGRAKFCPNEGEQLRSSSESRTWELFPLLFCLFCFPTNLRAGRAQGWMGSANSQIDWCSLAQGGGGGGTDPLWNGDNALESAAVWPPCFKDSKIWGSKN